MLTVIWAQEATAPTERDRIDRKLMTNLPVPSHSDALQKIAWYVRRWKIEPFHKVRNPVVKPSRRDGAPPIYLWLSRSPLSYTAVHASKRQSRGAHP